jgi:hypothetical protein
MKTFTIILLALSLVACNTLPGLPSFPSTQPTQPIDTPVPLSARSDSEKAVIEFLDAYIARDYKHVSDMYSTYSLDLFSMTRESMRLSHESRDFEGYRIKRYKIVDTKAISNSAIIVNTVFSADSDKRDYTSQWKLVTYLEAGHWRINAYGIIDKLNLTLSSTTINSVTVQPVAIERYADQLKFNYLLSNGMGKRLVWGWGGENGITFTFADGTQYASPFSTPVYMGTSADAEEHGGWTNRFAEELPVKVEIGGWHVVSATNSSVPDETVKTWSYSFEIKPRR